MRKSRKSANESPLWQRWRRFYLRFRVALGVLLLAVPVPATVLAEYSQRNNEHEVPAGEIIAAVVDLQGPRRSAARHARAECLAVADIRVVPRLDETTLPASAWPPALHLPPPPKIRLRWLN